MIHSVISFFISGLAFLIAVSFYTLLERKILGLGHMRLGPDVVSIYGLLQPFADGLKLFTKELVNLSVWGFGLYWVSPGLLLFLSLLYILLIPDPVFSLSCSTSLVLLLILTGVSVYPSLSVGWSPTSEWSLLGAVRGLAQTVSYEASLAFLVFIFVCAFSNLSFDSCVTLNLSPLLCMVPWVLAWAMSIVAELNRTPFDLSEAESELVSGVNIEFGGGAFGLLFISEYLNMIVFSLLSSCLFMAGGLVSSLSLFMGVLGLYSLVWIRVTLPRCRYDKLMTICWEVILPCVLILGVSILIMLF